MSNPSAPADADESRTSHRDRFATKLSRLAVSCCLIGVVSLFGAHALAGNWGLAVIIDIAVVLAAIAIGALIYGFRWSDDLRRERGLMARRIGWGSRLALLILVPSAFVCLVEASITTEPPRDRTTAGILGLIFVALVFSAATGRTTSAVRRLRASLPTNRRARGWSLGLLIVGLACAFMSLAGYGSVSSLRDHGVAVTGTVTNITTYKGIDNYFLSYRLRGGRTAHCSTEDVLGGPNIGDHIRVLYDSTDPTANCQSLDYGTSYTDVLVFGAISVLALSIGGSVWITNRTRAMPSSSME